MTKARETADVVDSKNQCTAWCRFDGTTVGANPPIDGFNVASVTRNATGDYTITFDTPMDNANYVVSGVASTDNVINNGFPLTGSVGIFTRDNNSTNTDTSIVSVQVFGGKN